MMASTAKGQPLGLATLDADGIIPDAQLPVGVGDFVQAAAVADLGALTSAAPSALTATAPAALTSAAITGGESPTEAEHNQVQADVAALRTTVAALVVDITALRATVAAAVVDLGASRTKLNAEIAALRTAQLQDT
jgi:outer membrane murein-binding lipoprotein Lpp